MAVVPRGHSLARMLVQATTSPWAPASEGTFWSGDPTEASRCSPFQSKVRSPWMSRSACQPSNCGTTPEHGRIRRLPPPARRGAF